MMKSAAYSVVISVDLAIICKSTHHPFIQTFDTWLWTLHYHHFVITVQYTSEVDLSCSYDPIKLALYRIEYSLLNEMINLSNR